MTWKKHFYWLYWLGLVVRLWPKTTSTAIIETTVLMCSHITAQNQTQLNMTITAVKATQIRITAIKAINAMSLAAHQATTKETQATTKENQATTKDDWFCAFMPYFICCLLQSCSRFKREQVSLLSFQPWDYYAEVVPFENDIYFVFFGVATPQKLRLYCGLMPVTLTPVYQQPIPIL